MVVASGIPPGPQPATRFFMTQPSDTHPARTKFLDGSMPPEMILEPGSIGANASRDGSVVCARLDRGWPHLAVRFANSAGAIMTGPGVEPQFSPDNKWLAYTEPGGGGISVRPFPVLR